jgi:diguanylate cyclase (GGDEF)-like protein
VPDEQHLRSDRRWRFALAGGALALGAPIGWYVIEMLVGFERVGLYVYLTVATLTVFSLFGYVLGRLVERAEHLAEIDSLTGLLNQTPFFRTAEALFRLGERRGSGVAVIMIDLDRFKSINDEHGHLFGSFIIAEAGKLLDQACRRSDLVSRFGGDEYTVFLPDITLEGATLVAERFSELLRTREFSNAEASARVTASIGVGHAHPGPGLTLRAVVEHADKLLYDAKDAGRDCFKGASLPGYDSPDSSS